jgi:hypothetical protein
MLKPWANSTGWLSAHPGSGRAANRRYDLLQFALTAASIVWRAQNWRADELSLVLFHKMMLALNDGFNHKRQDFCR